MKVLVIDGQGGGLGRQLVAAVKADIRMWKCLQWEPTAPLQAPC